LGMQIERGQIYTGFDQLSRQTAMSMRTLRTVTTLLETCGELTRRPTNRGTLYTIVNYECYDAISCQATSQVTSNRQATDKQPTASKEVKEVKEEISTPAKLHRGRAKKEVQEPTPEAWRCLEAWEKRAPLPYSKTPDQYRVRCALVFDALNGPRQLPWPRVHAICKTALASWYPKFMGSPLGLIENTRAGDMEKWQKIEQQSKPTEASHEVQYQEMPVLYGTR